MKKDYEIIKPHKESTHECFDLAKSKLSSLIILGVRARHYSSKVFYDTPEYENIRAKILNSKITLVLGNPLAGKTRIVFDTLNSLTKGFVIFPQPFSWANEYHLPNRKDIILFIDELDAFCEKNPDAINKLLYFAFQQGYKCIFTCRTGPELTKVKKTLNHQIWTELITNKIYIPRFSKEELSLQNFINENKDIIKNTSHFDGNIGSLILPLEDMRKRFQKLVEEEQDHAVAILKGLKLHYQLFNYESKKSYYNEIKIRDFCNRYLNEKLSNTDWEKAKQLILSTDTTLNFIEEQDDIIIEEVYLDCNENPSNDVIDETFNIYNIKKTLSNLYKDTLERHNLGFPTTIRDWNKIINKQENFNEAFKIFEQIPEYVKKDKYTYEALMKKTEDKEIRKKLFDELRQRGLDPRHTPNSTYFGKFTDFNELLEAIAKSSKGHLKFRTSVSDKLISLAKENPKNSLKILFNKYPKDQIFGNYVFMEICRKCCIDSDDYKNYIEPYLGKAPKLDTNLFKKFIWICSMLKQKKVALEFLDKYFKENNYDYYNQKANCLRDEQPEEALNLYLQAATITTNKKQMAISYNNYGQLIYEKKLQSKLHDGIINCYKGIKESKISHGEFPYLRYTLLLLIIWETPIETLIQKIEHLLSISDFTKNTVKHILPSVFNLDKQKVISEYLTRPRSTTDDIEQPIK